MFGSTPPFEYERPHATFLLPAILRPFRRSKPSHDSSRNSSISEDDHGLNHSNRCSVAYSPSCRTSTSSRSPPSLCSSPSSYTPSPVEQRLFSIGDASSSSSSSGSPTRHAPLPFVTATDMSSEPSSSPAAHPSLQRTQPDTLRCLKCSTDIAFAAQIVSKGFTGRHGRAYLVSAPAETANHMFAPETSSAATALAKCRGRVAQNGELINVRVGHPEQRQLATGPHVVADISCTVCRTALGWKYVDARVSSQHYKIGKFILETARVARFRGWEDADGEDVVMEDEEDGEIMAKDDPLGAVKRLMAQQGAQSAVEFDSDDDDECEEIFAGTWDADVVANRRSRRLAAYSAA